METVIEIAKAIGTPLGTAVLLALAGYFWLGHRLRPLIDINNSLAKMNSTLDGYAKIQQTMLTILGRANLIRASDVDAIVKAKDDVIGKIISSELASKNPLTSEQASDLQVLYGQLKRGGVLSPDEAHRLLDYAQTVSKERPNDPGTWELLAIASLALGYSTSSGGLDSTKGMYPPAKLELGDDQQTEESGEQPSSENSATEGSI